MEGCLGQGQWHRFIFWLLTLACWRPIANHTGSRQMTGKGNRNEQRVGIDQYDSALLRVSKHVKAVRDIVRALP